MPGLQDWPADPRTGPHCRGLRVLTGAYDCRYLMITVSKPSTKPLTSSLAFPNGIRKDPCLKPLTWRSRNVGVGCRQRKGHPPKWRVTFSIAESSRHQAFFRTPVNQTVIQYP